MFKRSDTMSSEYCAQIVKIGKIEPIENSDFLVKTMINGAYQVVVGKNDVKEGDVMVYCKLETAISKDFLSINNQFELGERELNKNYAEVEALMQEGKQDEAKKLVGYFNKHGRVRIVKLRGCPSEGCLFTIDSIAKWKPEVKNYDFEQCFTPNADGIVEPFNFDTIGNELFVKVYVPVTNQRAQARANKEGKRNRKLKRFDRLIDGQFEFLYDTKQLQDNIWRIQPDTEVTISVKIHGTSAIFGNLLVKKPKPNTVAWQMITKKLSRELRYMYNKNIKYTYWQKRVKKNRSESIYNILNSHYTVGYGPITSSRGVIKNQYINQNASLHSFYEVDSKTGKDVWNTYGDIMQPYIPKGLTVYGEIFGYTPTGEGYQKLNGVVCDYGCEVKKSKFMPYRITFTDDNGVKTEWEVDEVLGWTLNLIKNNPELQDIIMPIPILYKGTLSNLYPDVDVNNHWNENILMKMRNDKDNFGMECDEPLSRNKMPREGIVIRINNDTRAEAFKLKCYSFLGKEAKDVDKGIVDIEMEEGYGDK